MGERRRGAVAAGLLDRPLHRDWAFWYSLFLVGTAVASVVFPAADADDVPPIALMIWLSPLTIFVLLGLPVLLLRRYLRRAAERRAALAVMAPPLPSPGSPPPPPPTSTLVPAVPVRPPDTKSPPPPSPGLRPSPHGGLAHAAESWTGGDATRSAALTHARQTFPYPVARAARAVQSASDAGEQYLQALDLGEALCVTLGIYSVSWMRTFDPENPALELLRSRMSQGGLSQGTWVEMIAPAREAMGRSPHRLDGFAEGSRQRKGKGASLTDSLMRLVAERNRSAHGGRPHNRAEALIRTAEVLVVIEQCLELASFLADDEWVLVESTALRRHDQRFDVRLRRAMGDHPDFDATTTVMPHALANDTFYVMTERGALDLTPFLVLRFCEQCRQPEVCYADRILPKQGVSLKSFGRGHQVLAAELLPELQALGQAPGDASR